MTNLRQQKVGRLIQKEIADIFIKEGSPLCGQAMLTVTRVRMSPDLGFARVYISVFAV
ncbi:MAG: ribosome-binding factor A, partial [Flavobacteriales bacterium]